MRELPILFSAPMVRAILEGRKTQTRRIVKLPHPPTRLGEWEPSTMGGRGITTVRGQPVPDHACIWHTRTGLVVSPRWSGGDRLWVRETWGLTRDGWGDWLRYGAGGDPLPINRPGAPRFSFLDDGRRTWRPSIHMPKWASRIWLEVTAVRVERLHDITEEDAKAEGCPGGRDVLPGYIVTRPSEHFAHLWKSINGDESWDSNPWVWVVSFKRAERKAAAA